MKRSAAAFAAIFLAATVAHTSAQPQLAGPKPPASSASQPIQMGKPQTASPADLLFRQGEFEKARAAYAAVPRSSPQYEAAQRQLGAIALYQNHLGEAEALLNNAHALNPADMDVVGLLTETMHREGRFAEMAQLLHQLGHLDREAEFRIFGKATPYRMPAHQGTATVEMQFSDPLPYVLAKVNGFEGLFLIDTSAPEVILDPEFALYSHVQTAPQPKGARIRFGFGRVGQFTMTGVETDDVPVMLLSTRGLTPFARNKRVAGVIGTEFLSHFRPTIDYVHSRLVLEPHDAPAHTAGSIAEVPFWFVGDHFLVARGRLDQGREQMFLIDSGMAGTTFAAPKSTLQDANIPIPVPQGPARNVIGAPPTALFPITRLSLGTLSQTNLKGNYGSFPPLLEQGLGMHIGGMVSHGFFVPYAVTFDFVRMTIGFRK